MKISEIKQNIDDLKVDNESKNGIVNLIDIKIENDMKEVINKINSLEGKISEFEKTNLERLGIFEKTNFERLANFEKNNLERIGNLKWTIIVASGVLTIVLTILTFVLGK